MVTIGDAHHLQVLLVGQVNGQHRVAQSYRAGRCIASRRMQWFWHTTKLCDMTQSLRCHAWLQLALELQTAIRAHEAKFQLPLQCRHGAWHGHCSRGAAPFALTCSSMSCPEVAATDSSSARSWRNLRNAIFRATSLAVDLHQVRIMGEAEECQGAEGNIAPALGCCCGVGSAAKGRSFVPAADWLP